MNAVVLSADLDLVVPRQIFEAMDFRPGQKFQPMPIDGIIQLVPLLSIEEARGFLRGMDTTIEREPDREF